MYVLPQLEGLDDQGVQHCYTTVLSTVGAREELRARFAEWFPHVTLRA